MPNPTCYIYQRIFLTCYLYENTTISMVLTRKRLAAAIFQTLRCDSKFRWNSTNSSRSSCLRWRPFRGPATSCHLLLRGPLWGFYFTLSSLLKKWRSRAKNSRKNGAKIVTFVQHEKMSFLTSEEVFSSKLTFGLNMRKICSVHKPTNHRSRFNIFLHW